MENGLVHIYTGTGKGKTTSAVGLAVRALSHGKKVCYSCFNKKPARYGYTEIESLKKLGAEVLVLTDEHPFFNKDISKEEHKFQTQKGVETLKELIVSNNFDMLIMDEILISIRDEFVEEQQIAEFIKNKPENLELVMTGRGATDTIIEMADYVSYIDKIKHPMDNGIMSREGIEF